MEKRIPLDSGWRVAVIDHRALSGEIAKLSDLPADAVEASVPGDWPLDYVRAGRLDAPYWQDNYLKLVDYETHHVFYGTRFTWMGDRENVWLRFEGIDTVADIYLNGEKLGRAENMYIPHEFPAVALREGENELVVHISPAAIEARKHPCGTFDFAAKYNYEALVIRKATHMFGWDICPRIVSSGLWRPVWLVQKPAERIEDVYLWTDKLDADGTLRGTAAFRLELGDAPVRGLSLKVEGRCGGSRFEVCEPIWFIRGRLRFEIPAARLWWPAGYGAPDQYDVTVTLLRGDEIVDQRAFRQGFRTAELVRDDLLDDQGNGDFCFVINGRRIFVKGTNWVPADAFHSNDANRIPDILKLVRDVGCNALRVWGGGVYESDEFYDICDENGILVWQDFMMACGVYPHTERMQAQLAEEVAVTVRRLRRHASICLWAGDNECDQNYCWHDTRQDPAGNVLTRRVIPQVLHNEDITRPYLPSSPYVSAEAYRLGLQEHTTEQHLWGPRDYFKGRFYHDANAVFASEIGYHGCNSPDSLYRFIGKAQSWPVEGNPMYLYHAASPELEHSPYTYRIQLMTNQLRFLFDRAPESLGEYARMSQISQAEAKKFFIECFRSRRNRRTGLIWWNIMDCWPQISDAVVDYYFCKKLAYFYIRRSQQDVCLMMDDHEGCLKLYGVNDCLTDQAVRYEVTDVDTGEAVAAGAAVLTAEYSLALQPIRQDGKPHFYRMRWTLADGTEGGNHYLDGRPPYDYAWYMKCLRAVGYDEFEGFTED